MTPRFAMFYPDQTLLDDGEDVDVTFKVPKVWLDAPRDGMQCVVVHRQDGKLTDYYGRDMYIVMQNGQPMATDDVGPLLRTAGIAKYGLWIPDVEFDAVRQRVQEHRRQHERSKDG
jgi:hypothetical protein